MSRLAVELPDDDPRTAALVEALEAFGARVVHEPVGGRRTLVTGQASSCTAANCKFNCRKVSLNF